MTKNTTEKWKPITQYNGYIFSGRFEVSNWGNIRNADTKKPLAIYTDQRGQGYYKTKIEDVQGVRRIIKIHRLVAFYFLNVPENVEELEVNHIDGNAKNNSYTNLEFTTHAENMRKYREALKEAK